MTNMSQIWVDRGLLDILSIFTYDYGRMRYAREISGSMELPSKTVSRKLERADSMGLIKHTYQGKNKLYYLDLVMERTFHILMALESYKTMRFVSENRRIALILEKYPTKLVFGSFAKFKKGNDIDIVFFSKPDISEDIVHPQYTTKVDLRKRLSKKEALALEIADNHIILSDHEFFVRLFMEHYKNG